LFSLVRRIIYHPDVRKRLIGTFARQVEEMEEAQEVKKDQRKLGGIP